VYIVSYHTNVGFYSATPAYFASSANNAPLHGLANSTSPNGVFGYGGTQFPSTSYNATNYWVDVVFATQVGGATIPAVTSTTPAVGATGQAATTAPTATFNENVTATSISFTLTGPNNTAVAGTVSYNASTVTATFTPSSALAASTSYTATVSGATDATGNTMAAPYSWSFTTAAAAGTCPCTVFPASATPAVASANDSSSVELGMKFTSDVSGYVTGVRFYKGSSNTGTHVGNLWTASGTLLASVTFSNETASGWQQATFSTPVAITAGTVYIVSYHTNTGAYSYTSTGFATGVDNAPLHAPASGSSGGNGVFGYGGTQFPSTSYNATNYWVDVVFATQVGGATIPAVTSTTPASNATGVAVSAAPTATFNENVTAASIKFTLTGPNNTAVAGTVGYNASTVTATFTPSSALAASTSYTATVSGATDATGNTMAAPYNWSFTTGPAAGSCPCSLFAASATPSTVTVQDTNAVELGMKFTSDVSGHVTAIRFYKGSSNTGTHVGNLWTASGTLLASVTFSNETASGWQQATFSTPVAITAGTMYIVSYHTNVGFYSANGGYFNTGVDSGPLHAVANGTSSNGVYAYGSGGFPSTSYNATNYWVDVVFTTN
jgi:methionine-rich copper-binding protein CopC